ncbi:hypothetical protein WBJ53_01355 [Spirosoma sp. SC4-14]|uniref:hypothetical protein n=1 Tax=Spirosoma sp. SC4-14 TaxID=3128900 RepID=UPI0030CD1A40
MIQLILIVVLGLLAQLVLPWWSLAIVAFLVCFWRSSRASLAFFYGFAGITLLWGGYALLIHLRTDGIFTGRMSQLLFQTANTALPLIITALVGGLVGGFAGLSGYFVRQVTGNQTINRIS